VNYIYLISLIGILLTLVVLRVLKHGPSGATIKIFTVVLIGLVAWASYASSMRNTVYYERYLPIYEIPISNNKCVQVCIYEDEDGLIKTVNLENIFSRKLEKTEQIKLVVYKKYYYLGISFVDISFFCQDDFFH
jgi:hypothetical protein